MIGSNIAPTIWGAPPHFLPTYIPVLLSISATIGNGPMAEETVRGGAPLVACPTWADIFAVSCYTHLFFCLL